MSSAGVSSGDRRIVKSLDRLGRRGRFIPTSIMPLDINDRFAKLPKLPPKPTFQPQKFTVTYV